MDTKEIIDETELSLIEILKKPNNLPYVTEKITVESLQNMTKEEFTEFLIGRTSEDIND